MLSEAVGEVDLETERGGTECCPQVALLMVGKTHLLI